MMNRVIFATILMGAAMSCMNDTLCQGCVNNKCVYCANSYPSANGTCIATSSIKGCYNYANATSCQLCNPGYFQDPNGSSCTALNATFAQQCAFSWSNSSYCDQCRSGGLFNTASNSCDNSVACTDANCAQCYKVNGAMVCGQCKTGYAIWSSTGIGNTCAQGIEGCWATNTTGICLICNAGYYISNKTCVKNAAIAYADTYSGATITRGFVSLLALILAYYQV